MRKKEKRPLTREERRLRQKLEADLTGICVIGALVGLGFVIGRWN